MRALKKLYLVGGAVRDELLGKTSKDLDFVSIGYTYKELKKYILSQGGIIFQEREEFLTIRAKVPALGDADFVVGRKDGTYSDGRRPDNVFLAKTIEEELARRDFSINAIAKDIETGELTDPFNGQRDLQNKVIRCVGNPLDRFTEDALRVFRAIRFSVTLDFEIQIRTEFAMFNPRINYENVSAERIQIELNKSCAADWFKTFQLLSASNLIDTIKAKGIRFVSTLKQ